MNIILFSILVFPVIKKIVLFEKKSAKNPCGVCKKGIGAGKI
jgi:hypothetical protein